MPRAWNFVEAACCYTVPCILLGAVFAQQPAGYEFLLASAQQAQARGDFEAAAGFYRKASMLHPESAELKANLGLMYYQTDKSSQAADAFQQAVRLKPGLFVPNLFLGLDYVKLRRFNDALPFLKHAAQVKPDDVHAQIGLGEAYSGLKDMSLAVQSYRRATEIDPADADTWYRLGIAYLEQVEADARFLLAQHKDFGYTQALVAENFAEQRAFNEAAVSYQRALSLPAFPPGTHAGYGFVLLNHHDLPGAERELKAELTANPGSLLAKLGMARLDLEKGATDQGSRRIVEIWNVDADFLTLNAQRFSTGLAQQMRQELVDALEKLHASGDLPLGALSLFRSPISDITALSVSGSDASTSIASITDRSDATALYSRGAYRRCRNSLVALLPKLSSKDIRLLAFCAYSTGDFEHAFQAAEMLSASTGTKAEGLYWEAKSSGKLAAVALARASQIDSTSPKLHVLLGDIYRQQQLLSDAEQEYRKALTLRPGDTGALFGLSLALLGDSRRDEAFQVALTAVKENPNDPELNAVMGEILCDRDDFSQAEVYLKKSLDTKPEYVYRVHALLGKVYANTNRTREAIAELKLALSQDKDGKIYYQIGRLYLKVGDRKSAQQAFQESQRLEEEGLSKPLRDLQQGQEDGDSQ